MKEILEQLKKKRDNLKASFDKIYNVILVREHQLEKDKSLFASIEGRITELNETIQFMEDRNSKSAL